VRSISDPERIQRLLRELGRAAREPARVYLTGGAMAVLMGWRASTLDVDLVIVPDRDELLRAIERLKETLQVNVELASPAHFIPELPGWEERSIFLQREVTLDIYFYDPYAQALAKVERDHEVDRGDVREMIARGLVDPVRARALYDRIEPLLYKYPAIDARVFRRQVEAAFSPGPAPPPSSTRP
jgi:hypothetical protein